MTFDNAEYGTLTPQEQAAVDYAVFGIKQHHLSSVEAVTGMRTVVALQSGRGAVSWYIRDTDSITIQARGSIG